MTPTIVSRRTKLAVAAALAAVVQACAAHTAVGPAPSTARVPASLNNVSVTTLLDDFRKADLPAPNARDVTASKCPKLRCLEATDTDTVSVLKFPSTGSAEKYAGEISNIYQVEDVVVVFAPTLTASQRGAYSKLVKKAVVGP